MAQLTAFGRAVKHRLVDMDRSQTWLCEQVTKRTGLYCDSALVGKIFKGQNRGTNIRNAMCEILDIEDPGN